MSESAPLLQRTVLATAHHLLRPLVRLLLSHGVTLPNLVELLKRVLVDVAEHDLPPPSRGLSDSSISVLTGVHRKDVRRLRARVDADDTVPTRVSLGARVVHRWLTDARWLDTDGTPRPLLWGVDAQGRPGFERLAEAVSKDVRARVVCEELLRIGVAIQQSDGTVGLRTQAFVPSAGGEEALYFLRRGAGAHLASAVHNVTGQTPAFFDRMVYFDDIPASALPALGQLVERHGNACLQVINRAAEEMVMAPSAASQQFTFGIYLHTQPATTPVDQSI